MEDDPAKDIYTKTLHKNRPAERHESPAAGRKSPAGSAPRFLKDIRLLDPRDAALKRKREVQHASLMKQLQSQRLDADRSHQQYIREEGKRLEREKQHLRDAQVEYAALPPGKLLAPEDEIADRFRDNVMNIALNSKSQTIGQLPLVLERKFAWGPI